MKRSADAEQLLEAVGRAIADRRKELGISVDALSQESGVSQQAIANYEKLARRPSLECFVRVARGLGMAPSELLNRAEGKLKNPG